MLSTVVALSDEDPDPDLCDDAKAGPKTFRPSRTSLPSRAGWPWLRTQVLHDGRLIRTTAREVRTCISFVNLVACCGAALAPNTSLQHHLENF